MKNGLVIADAGTIFSLVILDKLEILNELFYDIKISKAVWVEITFDKSTKFYSKLELFFKTKVENIKGFNELTFVMDYGESESVILYKELNADFLLIDDKKARKIAENFNINCISTLGILIVAKNKGLINELRPLFLKLLNANRYYSLKLLNRLLDKQNEQRIERKP